MRSWPLAAAILALAGCGAGGEDRALEYFPDMARGPAYKAFAPNPATGDGLTLRVPVAGTLGFKKAEVTAGGVALDEVDSRTLQSKRVPGLFLAGELLDLDGPIGGYNFQAAWSTGWLAGRCAADG